MGWWYYKTISEEEFMSHADWFFQVKQGIHTDKELAEFCTKEQMMRDPLNRPQFRFIFIPDYTADSQVLILKIHHSMGDGVAIGSMLNAMTPEPKATNIIGLTLSCLKKLLTVITLPFSLIAATCHILGRPTDVNPIHTKARQSGIKKGAFNMDLKLHEVKDACKNAGCTINDFITSILSLSCAEYFERYKEMQPTVGDNFKVSMPFSLRPPITRYNKYEMNNSMCCMNVKIKLFKEFGKALPHFQK